MAKKHNKKAKRFIENYIRTEKTLIEVKAGKCRYNYKCHCNAVHDAIEHKEQSIALCVYIASGHPIVHFVNINDNGEYFDNTLGHWASNYDFYLIKKVDSDEFWNVDEMLGAYQDHLRNRLPFYLKLFSNVQF